MANEKISELPQGSPAQPGDEIPIARSGSNFYLNPGDMGGGVNLAIGGNTAGVPTTLSNGTAILVGGNNITLSQNANSITIVGNAGGGGGNFSAGVSNIGNTLGNTGVTGTQLVLAGDNNVTLSQFTSPSGATISISAFNQSVQTQNVLNASIAGNTAGAGALISSGTLFLAGGNNITLSQNGNTISISANTAVAANLSVSAGTSSGAFGGVTFQDSNNISWGLNNGTITATVSQSVQTQASGAIAATGFTTTSTNGSVVVGTLNTSGLKLGVPPYITTQTNQTQNLHDVSLSGNTAGALALISSGTMILAGGNNVTLSQNAQSITISAAPQTNQSMGIYASSQTTGQSSFSTVDARSISFVGSGNVSVGMSGGSVIIQGATAIPPSTGGVYVTSNTTGQSFFSTYQQSSFIMAGAGIVSLGWSAGSLIVSAPASTGISQSIYATGNTTQSSSGTASIGSLLVQGAGNVSVGMSNGSLVVSGSGGGGGAAVGMSTFGNTAGTTGTFSAGTVVLAGTGGVSLSQSTNTNGATISVGVPVLSLYATSNTTQGTSGTATNGSLLFNGAGNVSVGYSNGSVVISGAGGAGGGAAISIGGNSTSAGAGYSNITSGTAILLGGNNITLSQNGASITISGANAGGAQTGISGIIVSNATYTSGTVSFSNANGISFGSSAGQAITASYTVPSTAGLISAFKISGSAASVNATALTFSNSNNVTLGLSTGASAGTLTASYALNVSAGGGTSNALSGITFSNLNGISFGLSTGAGVGTMTASVPATSSLSATGWASISVNASTISIGAAAPQLSFFQPLGPLQATSVTQNGIGSIQVYPAIAAFPFTASRADIFASVSAAALAASTEAQTLSMYIGLYTLNGSTLSLASSGSQSYAWTNSSGGSSSVITGLRRFSAPINVNYTGGFDLFVGVMTNTTFANTNGVTLSNVVAPVGAIGTLNGLIGETTNNTKQYVPGQGFYSVTSAALPSSMSLAAITGVGGGINYFVPVNFVNMTA